MSNTRAVRIKVGVFGNHIHLRPSSLSTILSPPSYHDARFDDVLYAAEGSRYFLTFEEEGWRQQARLRENEEAIVASRMRMSSVGRLVEEEAWCFQSFHPFLFSPTTPRRKLALLTHGISANCIIFLVAISPCRRTSVLDQEQLDLRLNTLFGPLFHPSLRPVQAFSITIDPSDDESYVIARLRVRLARIQKPLSSSSSPHIKSQYGVLEPQAVFAA
ncbi:hypothetical protein SCHPADRAFT_895442 [Schizopora paradoxa]|uniref:Uncharacterized protein n=1 Tax=Schizopora paradoxa TaxID=27342 RepID=A0A0H2R3N9_9AGAM|nr:hypothetical protein SCHPADRAFT_895442 [Schizopora paradoxa]